MGQWRNTATTGLEPYLKKLGVGWAKRKVALAGTLLDRHMPRGVPPRAAAGLGL